MSRIRGGSYAHHRIPKLFLVLALLGCLTTSAQQSESGHYAFVLSTAFGTSAFRLTDDEKKNISPADGSPVNVNMVGDENFDPVLQKGNRKYHTMLERSDFPIIGQKGTNWILCYRTNSPWVDDLGQKLEYCIASGEEFGAKKSDGHVLWRGEEISVSDLRPVATLLTGMQEISWAGKIVRAAKEYYSTNGPELGQSKFLSFMGGYIGVNQVHQASEWLDLGNQVILNALISFPSRQFPPSRQFAYVSQKRLDELVEDNLKSDRECSQVVKDLEQAGKMYAEWIQAGEKQALEEKNKEAAEEQRQKGLLADLKSKPSGKPRGGLTIKGFFLGQNISESVDLYNSQQAAKNSGLLPIRLMVNPLGGFVTTVEYSAGAQTNVEAAVSQLSAGGVLFTAEQDGKVNRILISAVASDVMFRTSGMSAEKFVQEFNSAYKLGTFKETSGDNGTVWTWESSKGVRVTIEDKTVEIAPTPSEGETKFN